MSIVAENCRIELNNFVKTVLNAFDLYETYNALLLYSFGPRTLVEVAEKALTNENSRDEVLEIMNVLAEYASKELKLMIRQLSLQVENDMHQYSSLAWEVFSILDKYFPHVDMHDVLNMIIEELKRLWNEGKLTRGALPRQLLTHCGNNSVPSIKQVPLSRDSSFYEASVIVEPVCLFTKKFLEAFEELKTLATNKEKWTQLLDFQFNEPNLLSKKNAIILLDKLFEDWAMVTQEPHLTATLSILERICAYSEPYSQRTVYEEAQKKMITAKTRSYEKNVKNFQQRLTKSINAITTHNASQNAPDVFTSVKSELQFLILIAPKATLEALITRCLQNKDYTPIVIKILRGSQLMCNMMVTYNEKEHPLLVAIIDNLVCQSSSRLKSLDYVETFVYIVTALCRRKRSEIKEKGEDGKVLRSIVGDVLEDSIMDPCDVICYLALPRIFNSPNFEDGLKTMLMLLKRLFASTGSKDTEMRYTVVVERNQQDGFISVPLVFNLIHTLLVQHQDRDNGVSTLCFNVLKALGFKLKDDDILLPEDTTNFILQKLSRDAWWIQYAITEWYSHSMNNPKKEIPSGIYHAIPEALRQNCREIKVDFESAPTGCLLYSLFELGLCDADLAINLLNTGLVLLPLDDLLSDQIAMALVDCCAMPFFYNRIITIYPVLERIVELFDPRMNIPRVLDQVNDNILRAIRQVKSVQIIGRATRMAFVKMCHADSKYTRHYSPYALNCPKKPDIIADSLLQTFCELAKSHADSQFQLYRMMSRKYYSASVEYKRELQQMVEKLSSQLVILFYDAVMFTRFDTNNTPLNVLINTLSEYVNELQNSPKTDVLDKKKFPYKQTEYIYAKTERISSDSESEIALVSQKEYIPKYSYSDPHFKHPSQRNQSGYRSQRISPREWVDDRKSEASSSIIAVAKQIAHEKTRDQVNRRFNQPPLSRNYGNSNRPSHFSGQQTRRDSNYDLRSQEKRIVRSSKFYPGDRSPRPPPMSKNDSFK